MKLSKFVAILSWISVFALAWAMLFHLPSDNVLAVLTMFLFVIVALISSNIQAQKTQERD